MSRARRQRGLVRTILIAFAAWLAFAASVALAAPGGLDLTFNGTGKQKVAFGTNTFDRAAYVAVTPNGRLVAAGSTNATGSGDFAIARLLANGTPDPSFNFGGVQTLGTNPGVSDIGGGVVVLPDERIVVAGQGNSNALADFVIKQLNIDGSVDATFGSGGTTSVDFGAAETVGHMVRQSDGKLVIVGGTSASGGGDFAIVRLNPGGSLDTSFSGDGKQTIDFGSTDSASGVAIDPTSGKIVVAGQTGAGPGGDMAIARLNPDGSLDPSFGSGGKQLVDFGGTDVANDVAVPPDGRIVAVGSTNAVGLGDFAIARLDTSGALDTSFHGTGKLTEGYGAQNETARGVRVQQNGRIVVMGTGDVQADFVLSRLNADGTPDSTFGGGGTAAVDFGGAEFEGDVALQSDGQIVVAGTTDNGPTSPDPGDMAFARIDGDPVTGGGGGGPGGGSPAPTVSVTTQPAGGGHGLVINAHTTGATTITVDVNGDGKPDYSGPADQPFINITLPQGATPKIVVTAIGPGGATSTTVKVNVPGTGLPPSRMGTRIVTAASPALLTPGALGSTCTQGDIVEGIIDARGCFVLAKSPSALPAATAAVVARYYQNPIIPFWVTAFCAAEQKKTGQTTTCDKFKEQYTAQQPVYVASTTVRLNGLSISPRGGSLVIVYPDQFRVVAPNARVTLGSIPLKTGEIVFDLTNLYHTTGKPKLSGTYFGQTRPALTFDARRGLPDVGGFPLNAGAELAFKSVGAVRESLVTVHVMLPPIFKVFGPGPQPSAAGGAVASNDQSLHLDTLDINIPHASIGGIGLDQLAFHYALAGDPAANCSRKYWHATAQIHLGSGPNGEPGAGFILTPPPIQNGIAFCAGGFKSAGGQIVFGVPIPPPQLFPGVLLNEINFAIQLNPTVLRGGATISAVDLFKVSGTLLAAFATPQARYTLTKADAGANLQDLAPRTFTSTTFAVGGTLQISVPGIGALDIASGGFMYSYPDYVAVGAKANVELGIFRFDGSIGGQANVRTGHFEVDLSAEICLRGVSIACAGGLGIVSSKGVVACLHIGPFHPGVGLKTNLKFEVWLIDGCKPSHYWVRDIAPTEVARPGAAGQSLSAAQDAGPGAAGQSFTVARGETVKNIQVNGQDGAPKLLITGPGGQSLSADADGLSHSGALLALRSDQFGATYIGIDHGTPGRYTVTALPGSVPVGTLLATKPGYDTHFGARVSGRGARLTLHYDARRRGGGQRVTFYEDGLNVMHELGSSTGGHGVIHFTPEPGARGTRKIVARATVDGSPIADQTLARFHFSGTKRIGATRQVTVRRRGGTLTINWTGVAGAVSYGIIVNRSGGAQDQIVVSGRKHSLTVGRFPATEGAVVTVSARGPLGDWARGRTTKITRRQTPDSMFRQRLGKRRR